MENLAPVLWLMAAIVAMLYGPSIYKYFKNQSDDDGRNFPNL